MSTNYCYTTLIMTSANNTKRLTLDVFPLAVVEDVVDEIDEVKTELKGGLLVGDALQQVISEDLTNEKANRKRFVSRI